MSPGRIRNPPVPSAELEAEVMTLVAEFLGSSYAAVLLLVMRDNAPVNRPDRGERVIAEGNFAPAHGAFTVGSSRQAVEFPHHKHVPPCGAGPRADQYCANVSPGVSIKQHLFATRQLA